MSLTVEDGSGVAGAESYASLVEADQHFSALTDHAWGRATDAAKEGALKWAAQYADMFTYPGGRLAADQGLKWPRRGVEDSEGRSLIGLPSALRSAVFELAGQYLIEGSNTRQITREKIGQIDIAYEARRSGPSFAFRLLSLIGASAKSTELRRG